MISGKRWEIINERERERENKNYVKEDTNERDISTKNIKRINYLNNNNNYNIMKC